MPSLLALLLTVAAPLAFQPEPTTLIRLATGETLRVTLLESGPESLRVSHPVLGEFTLLQNTVELLQTSAASTAPTPSHAPGPTAAPSAAPEEPAEPEAPESPAPPEPPSDLYFWEGWSGSVEVGLNGTDGNSRSSNLRGTVGAQRKTELMESSADASYLYADDRGRKSKSRAEFNLRNDWLFRDSPWGFYALGRLEFDEFQDWRWRLSGFAGPSYTFIKDETTTLRGRVGAGVAREFGGADNDFVPQLNIGADFSHAFSTRSKLFASAEYYPSLSDFPAYRFEIKAGYEVLLEESSKTRLKLGITDRYDSDPGRAKKRNDFEYYAVLGWTF